MSTQTLKDSHFRVIGYVETDHHGKKTLKDAHYRVLGYYEPASNVTKDASFRVVAHGDMLNSLLHN